jgi:hypothetical protein
VIDRHGRDAQTVLLPYLPRTQLVDGEAEVGQVRDAAGRHEERPHLPLDRVEAAERQMIEVHVRDEHRIEGGQVLGLEPGLDEALRELTNAAREHRIGEHDLVVDLQERRRMSDPEHGEACVLVDRVLQLRDLARRREQRPRRPPRRARDQTSGREAARERDREHGCGDRSSPHQKYLMRKVPMAMSGP